MRVRRGPGRPRTRHGPAAERRRAYSARRYQALKWAFALYKQVQGCVLCGYHDSPAALDLHHWDHHAKRFPVNLSTLQRRGLPRELEKCVVVCANCHRCLHFEEEEDRS